MTLRSACPLGIQSRPRFGPEPGALIRGNVNEAFAIVQQGLNSSEHAEFVARLADAPWPDLRSGFVLGSPGLASGPLVGARRDCSSVASCALNRWRSTAGSARKSNASGWESSSFFSAGQRAGASPHAAGFLVERNSFRFNELHADNLRARRSIVERNTLAPISDSIRQHFRSSERQRCGFLFLNHALAVDQSGSPASTNAAQK